MALKRKNSENTKTRKFLEKQSGKIPEESETTSPPDFGNIREFLEHVDRLVSDENIDGARKEIQKLKNHFTGFHSQHLGVLPIDRHLYDDVASQCEILKCHSMQSMISVMLRHFLTECFITHNKPKMLENFSLRKGYEFKDGQVVENVVVYSF